MSKYYEAAMAIDARDYDVVIGDIKKISPKPKEFTESTPDEDYTIFYWGYVLWEGDAVTALLRKLEGLRHALYTISEDDEVWKDVEISDNWGTDEQFNEILDVSAKLRIWGDSIPLEEKQVASYVRKAVDITWVGDKDDEVPDFLPSEIYIPEYVRDDDIEDYLSDLTGYLFRSYAVEEKKVEPPFDLSLPFPWAKYDISDEELEKLEEKEANEEISARGAFYNAVLDDTDTEFVNLISDYRAADKNVRSVIDAILVRLCGWSLPSLLRMASEEAAAEEEGGAA